MFVRLNGIKDVIDFVGIVSKYECDVNVQTGKTVVDGKSLMGMFMLNYPQRLNCSIIDHKDEAELLKSELELRGYQIER